MADSSRGIRLTKLALAWLLVASALLAAGPSVLGVSPSRVVLGSWESSATFYLGATSQTSGPFLSQGIPEQTAASFTLSPATEAPSAWQAQALGARGPTVAFRLAHPLEADYWLNLSKPIVGTLFLKTGSSPAGVEHVTTWVEVWAGTKFVGGDQTTITRANPSFTFWSFHLKFRPEAEVLPKGAHLELRLGRVGGSLVELGTQGTFASHIEFRYFSEPPMAGTFYLEDGRLTRIESSHDEPTESAETRRDPAPLGVLGGLLLAGLALTSRRSRPALLIALLVAVGMAGCASPKDAARSDGDLEPTSNRGSEVEVEVTDDPVLKDQGFAAIQGFVRDGSRAGIPLPQANVTLVGFGADTLTDAFGAYKFERLGSVQAKMSVSKKGFLDANHTLELQVGQRAWVNFTLIPPWLERSPDHKPHRHDMFATQASRAIVDDLVFQLNSQRVVEQSTAFYLNCDCETPILLPMDSVVFAGTGWLEVRMDWSRSSTIKEIGLRITTKGNVSADQVFLPRGPDVPFRIPIFPNEADSGHASMTEWTFHALLLPPVGGSFVGPIAHATPRIALDIVAHKGSVPYEAAHRAFWGNETALPVLATQTYRVASLNGDTRNTDRILVVGGCQTPGCVVLAPDPGRLVPPGTGELRGKISWVHEYNAPWQARWSLAYRTADDSPSSKTFRLATMTGWTDRSAEFTIRVPSREADDFYLSNSRWRFYPTYEGPSANHTGVEATSSIFWKVTLDVTARRAPGYVEDWS